MALLDTASLIVTPNGYKTSKLYSIVPTDGTGDLTWTRTGNTATRVNSSSLIETVNANIPRLDYLDSTCPKLLLEPQRTNSFLRSSEFDNAYWSKLSLTVTADSVTAPDGTTTADTLNCVATAFNLIRRNITLTSGSTYTASLFVKKNNYRYFALHFYTGGGISLYNFYDFDTNTVNNTNIPSTPLKVENYGNGWFRLSITNTIASAFPNLDFGYCTSTGSLAPIPAGTEKYYAWGAQVELGSSVSSFISTTTATVTRNADAYSKTSASALIGQTEGAIFIDLNLNSRIAYSQLFVRNTAVSNYIGCLIDNTKISAVVTDTAVGQAQIDYTNSATGRFKIAMAYKANDFVFYVNGTLVGTDTSGTVPTCDIIDFSYYNPNNIIKVNSAALWKTRIANTDLATLTTL
jgi:hypothetical protein